MSNPVIVAEQVTHRKNKQTNKQLEIGANENNYTNHEDYVTSYISHKRTGTVCLGTVIQIHNLASEALLWEACLYNTWKP